MSTPDCVPPPSCIPPVAMKAGDVEAAHIVSHSPSHGGSSSPAQPSPAQPSQPSPAQPRCQASAALVWWYCPPVSDPSVGAGI